jgi:glycosyltransferase involved in cell wall biosynthesis
MHINYVMWGVGRTGGTVTFTELGKRLIGKGHRVTITTFDDGSGVMTDKGFKPKWEPDIPIEYIQVNSGNRYWTFLCSAACYILKPRAFVGDWDRINRIVDYMPECDINVATWFPSAFSVYLSKKGRAQFYHMQHYEPLFFDAGAPFVPRSGPGRALFSRLVNRVAPWSLLVTSASRLAELSYLLPLNRIANSSWLQKIVKEKHGVESTVINHAIRNEVFYPRPQIEKSSQKRILCLGKTDVFWKGVGTLADALKIVSKKHDDVELVLYGSESHPHVDFPYKYVLSPGFEELAELYCSSSIVVCPSWYESFPAPPLEGMACGVPVVTTSIGVEDYARDGENCLVVPPRNPEAMADAILRLLSDKDLCQKLSEEGPKTAQQFTWDRTADKVEKLFEQTLRKGD